MKEQIGKIFVNRFEVRKHLTRTHYTNTYAAWDKSSQKMVSLSVINPPYSEDKALLTRFKLEAPALKDINHPNILHFRDFYTTEDSAFYITDLPVCISLKRAILINPKPFHPELAHKILEPLCKSLGYAHYLDFIHRDINSENVFLGRESNIFLGAFGLPTIIGEKYRPEIPFYTAPELNNEGNIGISSDLRIDIFALGVVLYEMLSGGVYPYQGNQVQIDSLDIRERVIWEMKNRTPDPPSLFNPEINPALDDVVLRVLLADPSKRFSSAMEFLNAYTHAMRTKTWAPPSPAQAPFPPKEPAYPTTSQSKVSILAFEESTTRPTPIEEDKEGKESIPKQQTAAEEESPKIEDDLFNLDNIIVIDLADLDEFIQTESFQFLEQEPSPEEEKKNINETDDLSVEYEELSSTTKTEKTELSTLATEIDTEEIIPTTEETPLEREISSAPEVKGGESPTLATMENESRESVPPAQIFEQPAQPEADKDTEPETHWFGRIEYKSNLHLNESYTIRIGFQKQKHTDNLSILEQVTWFKLNLPTSDTFPFLNILPSSAYVHFTPAALDVKLDQEEDTTTEFNMIPFDIPDNEEGKCELSLDFTYDHQLLKKLLLPIHIKPQN